MTSALLQLQKAKKYKLSRDQFNELVANIAQATYKKLGYNRYVEKFYQFYQDTIDNGGITFDMPSLRVADLQEKYRTNPSYERTKTIDLTFDIIEFISSQIYKLKNVIFTLIGEQRGGKSWSAIFYAACCDDTISPKQICFGLDDSPYGPGFFTRIGDSVPGQAFVIDEKLDIWGTGQKRIKGEGRNIIAAIGKRRNSVLSCSPEVETMGYSAYNFEPELLTSKERLPWGWCQLVAMNASMSPIGRVFVPSAQEILGNSFVSEYEHNKDVFLESLVNTEFYTLFDIRAMKVVFDPRFEKCSNKEDRLWLVNDIHKNLRDNTEATKLRNYIDRTLKMDPDRFERLRQEQLKKAGLKVPEPERPQRPILFETTTEDSEKKESEKFDFRSEEQIMADKVLAVQNKNKSKQEIFHEERQKRKSIMEKLKKDREDKK